jgi:hypothetical protein
MIQAFLKRVPWGKFLLLWALSLLMGSSLLWLHYGLTPALVRPTLLLWLMVGSGLLWGTTRPRWQKAHCAWCGFRLTASSMKHDEAKKVWVLSYPCPKCGHVTEKEKRLNHEDTKGAK